MPVTTSAITLPKATRENRRTARAGTGVSAGPRYRATSSAVSPPSQVATAIRWTTSTGMARPAWRPTEACSDIAQVAARPTATTLPPTASPKVRSRFSSSSRLSYAPKSTAMNSAAAASSSSRETSAAPDLVCSTSPSRPRSKTSATFPEPV
ncbi:hypothetical protein SVIOM342S_06409 [Streptomyces violaceorubidus]